MSPPENADTPGDETEGGDNAHIKEPGSSTPSITMLAAAVDLARKGWKVLPCNPSDKSPLGRLVPHGHLDASSDVDRVRDWWVQAPTAMIGAAIHPALIVVDLDPRNGGTVEAWERAIRRPVAPTLTVWSGRGDGGRHLYYRRPGREWQPPSRRRVPDGIDVKVSGYCIVPPSVHPATGQPYRWAGDRPEPLPPEVLDLLRPADTRKPSAPTFRLSGDGDRALVRFVAEQRLGNVNNGLHWAASRAAERGSLDRVGEALVAAAMLAGESEIKARRTVASAARAAS